MNIKQIKFFCAHESHIARYRGYGECLRVISNTNDENSPIWNDLSDIITSCCVGDSHEPSQEKGLEAVLAFVDRAPPKMAGAIVNQVMHQVINNKGLIASSSNKTKTLSIELTLLFIEIGKSKEVQIQLLKGINSQNPKIIPACISTLTQCLYEFGPQVVNTGILLEKLPELFEFYQTELVRYEAKMMAVELNKWAGPELREKLKMLEAELEHLLESQENGQEARSLRQQRYQQQNSLETIDDEEEEFLELGISDVEAASLEEKVASCVNKLYDNEVQPVVDSNGQKIDEKVVEMNETEKINQQNVEMVQVFNKEASFQPVAVSNGQKIDENVVDLDETGKIHPENVEMLQASNKEASFQPVAVLNEQKIDEKVVDLDETEKMNQQIVKIVQAFNKEIKPVNILMRLPDDFYSRLESRDRFLMKITLEYLEKVTAVPKMESDLYLHLVVGLKNVFANNVDYGVIILAAKCLRNLANGLEGRFQFHAGNCLSTLLKTFHITKPHVVAVLRETVDTIYQSMNIDMIVDIVVLELTNWNASVRAETAGFLSRCLRKTPPEYLNNNLLRIYSFSLINLLDDRASYVKASSAEALGTLMKLVGEEIMMEFLRRLNRSKINTIKNFAASIEI